MPDTPNGPDGGECLNSHTRLHLQQDTNLILLRSIIPHGFAGNPFVRSRIRFMKVLTSSIAILTLSLLLGGCGAEDAGKAGSPAADQQATPSKDETAAKERGDCDLFTQEELSEAFGGKLTFGKLVGYRGRGSSCTVSVQGYEGEFILQAESREAFENRRETYFEYERQGSATMVPVDVGAEAYLFNNAQVIAIDSEGRAINTALQLFVFGEELPLSKEEVAAGVQTITRQALDRL